MGYFKTSVFDTEIAKIQNIEEIWDFILQKSKKDLDIEEIALRFREIFFDMKNPEYFTYDTLYLIRLILMRVKVENISVYIFFLEIDVTPIFNILVERLENDSDINELIKLDTLYMRILRGDKSPFTPKIKYALSTYLNISLNTV